MESLFVAVLFACGHQMADCRQVDQVLLQADTEAGCAAQAMEIATGLPVDAPMTSIDCKKADRKFLSAHPGARAAVESDGAVRIR